MVETVLWISPLASPLFEHVCCENGHVASYTKRYLLAIVLIQIGLAGTESNVIWNKNAQMMDQRGVVVLIR